MNELERQNAIKVNKLTAYRSEYSSRNFFKVILANRADKELIVRRGILYLYNARLHVTNSCQPPPDRRARPDTAAAAAATAAEPQPPAISEPPAIPEAPTLNVTSEPPVPSAQTPTNQGSPTPRVNAVSNPDAQQQHTSTSSNGASLNGQVTQVSSHLQPNTDIQIRVFDTISARLSQGLRNPEFYVYLFNKCLVH